MVSNHFKKVSIQLKGNLLYEKYQIKKYLTMALHQWYFTFYHQQNTSKAIEFYQQKILKKNFENFKKIFF